MILVGWLVTILALYFGLWLGVVGLSAAWQTGRKPLAAALVLPFLLVAFVSFATAQYTVLGFGGAMALVGGALIVLCRDAKPEFWNSLGQARRATAIHLALTTGALIFLVPFAWLLVTSFKEDVDMSRFPPVWVPQRQVEQRVDGKMLPVGTMNFQGAPAKVAVVEELENGDRRVKILEPLALAGKVIDIPREQFEPTRKPGLRWENYTEALDYLPAETNRGLLFLTNTLVIVVMSIIGTLLSSSLVAYGFARLRFPGRDALFFVLIATMMLPAAVTMLPTFLIFRWLGWVDTLYPLWVPAFFGTAFNVFLLRQFFMTIPKELEEAARIDGSSYLGTFWRIMLPQVKPALAAVTIWTFMGAWNNFLGPLIYINSPEKMPLAYALQLFQQQRGGEPGMMMAASTLVMIPVIVVFFFTQRYFIQGVTLTGMKG